MRPTSTLGSSPTLIGAVTVLVTVVAVFLAYNANSGLPFVPTYRISVEVPNAAGLVRGNEVRIGGVRAGLVEAIEPVAHEDGSVTARLDLKLDRDAEPVPANSTVIVRSRSALGLKYLEINEGDSELGFPEGARVPLAAARPEPVEIDEVLASFDAPTRDAIQRNLVELGNALAGRGSTVNAALGDLPPVLRRLGPVMRNLGAPETRLARLVRALGATAAELAPVAERQARLFGSLDTTFGALAEVARPFIQETISEAPPTEEVAIRSLPRIRPFLRHSAALFAELEPGAEALREAAPPLAAALELGAPVLAEAPELNAELPPTAEALEAFGEDPAVRAGLARLTELALVLDPTLGFVTPAQTVCNYGSLLFRNASSLMSAGNDLGTWQRFIVFDVPKGPNSEGSPSSAPASGGSSDPKNFLHVNPYPNTASPGQPRECEAGNERFISGRTVIGNIPGSQGTLTEGRR